MAYVDGPSIAEKAGENPLPFDEAANLIQQIAEAPTTMEILNQVLDQEPVPPRRINPRIPRDLETICLKCLRKETSRRDATANELVEEISRFQRGETIRSRPVSRFESMWRWCRRNPPPAFLAAALCTAILITAIVLTTFLNRAKAEQRRFAQQQRSVETLSQNWYSVRHSQKPTNGFDCSFNPLNSSCP